jgi:chorismate mutase
VQARGIRGAAPVRANTRAAIAEAGRSLALKLVRANRIAPRDIACVIFTLTPDLNAAFPASAVRRMKGGWEQVPLICAREIDVPGAMPGLLRILMIANSSLPQAKIRHIYVGRASRLRRS